MLNTEVAGSNDKIYTAGTSSQAPGSSEQQARGANATPLLMLLLRALIFAGRLAAHESVDSILNSLL